ncbi:MAG: zf-HC2 domain-containing protein [Solirubrobacteraceae bacterium]
MLTPVPPTDCMLARESASARLDNELSELENARLDAHLRGCAECLAYAEEIGAIAVRLRAAALELPAERFVLPRRRVFSGVRLQAAVAAAAVAVVAAVAGSSFTLGHFLGVRNSPVETSTVAADLLSLRADSTQQHLLAMLPQLEPLPRAHPGQLEPV